MALIKASSWVLLLTGNQITLTGIDILGIAEGKVVEHWGNSDLLGMMRQLGAIPEQEQAGS